MNSISLASKEVKAIINATFDNYRKRTVLIKPTTTVRLSGLNWDGGSRTEYRACTIDGRPANRTANMSGPPPWANPFEGKSIEIPEGFIVVSGGHFCGKVSTLTLHVHPNNMPKLIKETN